MGCFLIKAKCLNLPIFYTVQTLNLVNEPKSEDCLHDFTANQIPVLYRSFFCDEKWKKWVGGSHFARLSTDRQGGIFSEFSLWNPHRFVQQNSWLYCRNISQIFLVILWSEYVCLGNVHTFYQHTLRQCCRSGSVGSECFLASRIRIHWSNIRIRILLWSSKNS